ncbi:MAG: tetratricopeptide repeat protein, partial [Spirochaetales bacterium]|nr:tetratricopeptide repeat protein [Spirochaetales bacterium]
LYQYGLCAVRNDKPGDAVDAWERITALDPSDDLALKAWQRAGDLYFHTGHFDNARKCYGSLAGQTADPDAAARGLLSLAMCDYNEGLDEKALTGFRKVMSGHEGTPVVEEAMEMAARAVYRLGIDNHDSGRLAQLVDEFPASPLAADAQFEIGLRHYEEKMYTGAAVEFKRMVNLFPTSSSAGRAWFLMADSWTQIDSVETARVAWVQFLEYFPESSLRPSAVFRLGMIRFNEGDYTTAAADFAEVLESGVDVETEYAAAYNLGMSLRILGKKEEAIAALASQRTGGENDDVKKLELARLVGEIHEEEGAFDNAAAEYARALGIEGVDPGVAVELHYRQGLCLEKRGDVTGAMSSYKEAMAFGGKTDPFRLSAVARYASLNEEKGDFKGALLAYRDLMKNTDDPELAVAARERADEIENAMR